MYRASNALVLSLSTIGAGARTCMLNIWCPGATQEPEGQILAFAHLALGLVPAVVVHALHFVVLRDGCDNGGPEKVKPDQ